MLVEESKDIRLLIYILKQNLTKLKKFKTLDQNIIFFDFLFSILKKNLN
jgi:hypothetical protein